MNVVTLLAFPQKAGGKMMRYVTVEFSSRILFSSTGSITLFTTVKSR